MNHPCQDYVMMNEKWELIRALSGGTLSMREAREKYLPREEAEKESSYVCRLNRTILYNGLSDAISKMSSRPFSRPITISDKTDLVTLLEEDMTLDGQTVTQFSSAIFEDAAKYGMTHVLIDHTVVPEEATVEDEKNLGARPFFTLISPFRVFFWIHERGNLKEVRIWDERITHQDQKEVRIPLIRVYRNDSGTISVKEYVQNEEEWVSSGSVVLKGISSIPLKTLYFRRKGYLLSEPPFEDLAYQNLLHWQSSSDQRNILRFCRAAILFGTGFSREEVDKGIQLGGDSLTLSTESGANLRYVEHSGAAISAGRQDLQDIESKMEILGLQPTLVNSRVRTATEKLIDSDREDTELQRWVGATQDFLYDLFRFAFEWRKEQLPSDFSIRIFSDFKLQSFIKNSSLLVELWKLGLLQDETLLSELKGRGELSESINVAEEILHARKP